MDTNDRKNKYRAQGPGEFKNVGFFFSWKLVVKIYPQSEIDLLMANKVNFSINGHYQVYLASDVRDNLDTCIQGRIQDFKLGGALKKIAPSGGRREIFWGFSCEKSRFHAKKSYFFQFQGGHLPLDPPLVTYQFIPILDT